VATSERLAAPARRAPVPVVPVESAVPMESVVSERVATARDGLTGDPIGARHAD
jgi:hypothetical protein